MPFKSEAQRRLFHAKAAKGEISQETVHEWEHATKDKKSLPMHVKKSAAYDEGAYAALAVFSKLAYHADDRMQERIKAEFPPGALKQLRDQAFKLKLSPGKYYLPLKDVTGRHSATAAFKTVGKDNKLVLATVLKPKSKPPPGTSLSHLMKQPQQGQGIVGKVDASQKQYTIRKDADGRLTCSCRDFKFRRAGEGTNCKHIDAHLGIKVAGVNEFLSKMYRKATPPTYSSHPGLRAIQESAQSGYHRAVDLSHNPQTGGPTGLLGSLAEVLRPKVDTDKRSMSLLNRVKFWLQEGGEAIPYAVDPKTRETFIPGKPGGVDLSGVVSGRHMTPHVGGGAQPPVNLIRGGQDLEGPYATQQALSDMSRRGKGFEAELMKKYSPGSMPRGEGNISRYFTNRSDRHIGEIQEQMKKDYGGQGVSDFAIKPTHGMQSRGAFPLSSQDWGEHLTKFKAHIADPKNMAALEEAARQGPHMEALHLRDRGLLEGHTLHNAFRDPSSVMAQQWLPDPVGEWRVHTVGGAAPESMMTPRYLRQDPLRASKDLVGASGIDRTKMREFVEKHMATMPENLRGGSYGIDLMPFKNPAGGEHDFKILEMNPTQRAGLFESPGARSGFLDASVVPWAGHTDYRAVTGRHSEPVMALGALGALGTGAIAAKGAHSLYRQLRSPASNTPMQLAQKYAPAAGIGALGAGGLYAGSKLLTSKKDEDREE